jgi:phage terminase large subunit GpA-like protein
MVSTSRATVTTSRNEALALVAERFAAVLAPQEGVLPSEWAAANLVVPDGPRAGTLWDPSLTPYLIEPLDLLAPDSGVNEIAVMKGVQSGFTGLLIAAISHSIACDPCMMMVLQPTDSALYDFNREKLQPTIDRSPALSSRVEPQTSRGALGSTTYSKRYPGGSLTLSIASSAAELRSKTIKKLFRDEIDEYPDDLDGQGDPLKLSDGRLTSFLTSGDWKKLDISTPTVKGASKIETRYLGGDQRRWHVPCPGCGNEFVLEFGSNFRFEESRPFNPRYVAPCCGHVIRSDEKQLVMSRGRWIATGTGLYPSYHFDSFPSPMVPWETIVEKWLEARDDEHALKSFYNLWLGLPYEIKGDAPDHTRLMERREAGLTRGHVPPAGLLLVGAADVQMRGIWVEITAFAPDRQSWTVDAFYIDGGTESPVDGAFAQLASMTIDREFAGPGGTKRRLDAFAIDSGYRSHVVYAWARVNQRQNDISGRDVVLAVKGDDGWSKPPISTPSLVDIDLEGFRVKSGCRLWRVGTWPVKGALYENLRKEGIAAGAPVDPAGYCHFGMWLDETYFKQLTSEYLLDEVYRGKPRKVWKLKASERDNHLLDCRVYSMALAEYLGISSLTPDEWASIAASRDVAADDWKPLARQVVAPPIVQPSQVQDAFTKLAALNEGVGWS